MTSPARAPRPTPRRATPAPPPRRPRLAVVPTPSPRRRTGAVVVAAAVVVFGSLLVATVFYGMIAAGQVHLDHVDARLDQEKAALARERYQLANLQSPERIAQAATRLGMVPATTQTWMSSAGTAPMVTGEPGTATAGAGTDQRSSSSSSSSSTGGSSELASGGGTKAGA